ncbi:MAG: UvrD-helicase domain-containing protein [Pirellulales bacterium]|nr:UvrD-helicase domain-containing protein [Pirellulales bacterium]
MTKEPLDFLRGLNQAQQQAAAHVDGPLLVVAGPGSGKTRVVTHRIAHMIASGVRPESIVALTFTNKAADEMRQRVTHLVGPQPVEMGTFHRFSARLLRRHARMIGLTSDYSIFDTDDAAATLKRAAKRAGVALARTPIDRVAGIISRAKNDLVTPETFEPRWGRPVDEVAARIWPVYAAMMLEANAVDFDDLLVHVARLLLEHPELRSTLDIHHRYILVDEYQDTNAAQYCILRGLSIDHPNLAVTGDPDQAIYGWRGASIRNILEFERDYPAATVVKLERNYRSTANILGTADRLIARNTRRKPKQLVTDAEAGSPVRIVLDGDSREEADRIAAEIADEIMAGRRTAGDFGILFRTNALSRSLEVALRSCGVPYQLVRGLEFFKRREIRDIVAWLRLLKNPRDDEAFLRVVNVPPRGIGKTSLDRLGSWAADHGLSLLEAAAAAAEVNGVSKRAQTSLATFARLHAELGEQSAGPVAPLVNAVLDRSGYRAMLAADADEDDGDDRLANVEELVTVAAGIDEERQREIESEAGLSAGMSSLDDDPLGSFLESVALVADTDIWDPASPRVSLMTLHAAKGLEFPVVYLVALEDGIVPHERSLDHPEQLEEERRLVFVGITRAREHLHASCARIRDYRGSRRISPPSVFLAEMSGEETQLTGSEAPSSGTMGRALGGVVGSGMRSGGLGDPFADDDACQLVPDDDDASQVSAAADDDDVSEARPLQAAAAAARPPRRSAGLAAMSEKLAALAKPAIELKPGQRVRHAEYGDGLLEKVGGAGPRMVGTVIFDGSAGRRTFILSHATLEPVG